jgi:hypothetical protein
MDILQPQVALRGNMSWINGYKVRAELDVESGACWIWLDDELVTDGRTPAEEGIANPDAYKGIRGVTFVDCSWHENPSTPTYFDDFRFYIVQPSALVVAEANGPYVGLEKSPITFDASGSYSSSGSSLSYRWDFNNDGNWDTDWSNEPTTSFTYGDDWMGDAKLEVRDGTSIGSDTAFVTINNVNQALDLINNYIQGLPDNAFDGNPSNRKKAFLNKFAEIENFSANGNYLEVIAKLKNDIRSKADGTIGGNPKNDWIKDSIAQEELCLKIDYLVTYLGKLQFKWCDLIWNVKSGRGGPGVTVDNPEGNYWSINNVWLDDEDNLHLKISKDGDRWYCAEIWTNERLPFGKYQFWINNRIDQLDKNVVLGMFNYPDFGCKNEFDGTNEIDIEIAKWGVDSNPNGNYAVYPGDVCDKAWNYTFPLASLAPMTDYTTHRFDWSSTNVIFQSLRGHKEWDDYIYTDLINQTVTPLDWAQHIPQQPLPVHINLWLFQSKKPTDDQPVEVVIGKFEGPSIDEAVTIGEGSSKTKSNSEMSQAQSPPSSL